MQPYWDAGLVQLSQVSDFLWHDVDGDGVQGAGEPGFPAVTVSLLDASDLELMSTTTDDSGRYDFTNVPDGLVRVAVDIPTGYQLTTQNQGSDDAKDFDLDATGLSELISINQEIERTVDGGFVLVPPFFADFGTSDTTAWSATNP